MDGKKIITVTFKNPTREDFTWNWDGEAYTFPAGSAAQMPEWLARHFARHLAWRECCRQFGKNKFGKEKVREIALSYLTYAERADEPEPEEKQKKRIPIAEVSAS
ncbi:MAG: hypothetical protein QME66_05460 [Candidatus Eisenbacteria bacterium]|nr:hypothetical protein [Candidatus Eisenbacteria bacterium]